MQSICPRTTPLAINTNEVTPIIDAKVDTTFAFGKKKCVLKMTILEKTNNIISNLFSDLRSLSNLIIYNNVVIAWCLYFLKNISDE